MSRRVRPRGSLLIAPVVATALLTAVPMAPPLPAPAAHAGLFDSLFEQLFDFATTVSPAKTEFADINPDNLGPTTPCPAPCVSGHTGGRVHNLSAVPGDPDTYFAASEVGGLFKYHRPTNRWQHLDGHLPTLTWDVAAAPGGETVYATSFYDGRVASRTGFQISRDGGTTWSEPTGRVPDPPASCQPARASQPSAFGIALRPGSDEVLIGTNCGIARSTDAGTSWSWFDPVELATAIPGPVPIDTPLKLPKVPTPDVIPTEIVGAGSVWDVVALPGGHTYACGDDGLIWSPDGGPTTWEVVPRLNLGLPTLGDPTLSKPDPTEADPPIRHLFGFCSLAVSPDEPNVVIAMFGFGGVFDGFGTDGGRFFEGDVLFVGDVAVGVEWSTIPHPDSSIGGPKRVPFAVTNDRSTVDLADGQGPRPGFDLWFGGGNLVRVPCVTGRKPRCSTDPNQWSPQPELTYTDKNGQLPVTTPHGDSGDVAFDPATSVDACPTLYASDGGVYRQLEDHPTLCHERASFDSANAGLHAFLPWGVGAANRPGTEEDLVMATQDNGVYATRNAGAPKGALVWKHTDAGPDGFDVVIDDSRIVEVDNGSLLTADLDFQNVASVVPFGLYSRVGSLWGARESIAGAGNNRYMIASRGFGGGDGITDLNPDPVLEDKPILPAVPRGVLDSHDISAPWFTPGPAGSVPAYTGPSLLGGVPWPEKAKPPCHIQVARGPEGPQPFVLAGICDYASPDELWTFIGRKWVQLHPPVGLGFHMIGVDRKNRNRLYAATLDPASQADVKCCGTSRMIRSTNGGFTWEFDDELTELMHGRGALAATSQDPGDGVLPAPQPVMVAYDPRDGDVIVAGSREAGLFLSSDAGESWAILSDPFTPGTSGIPHLPRPFFAHFEHRQSTRVDDSAGEGIFGFIARLIRQIFDGPLAPASQVTTRHLYLGTMGRGVWRVDLVEADVLIALLFIGRPGGPGSEVQYAVEVANDGPGVAHHVEMENTVPPGTTFQSVDSPPGWSCTPPAPPDQLLRCQKREMAPAEHAHFFVTTTVDPATPSGALLSGTARVVSAAVDPDPSDNADSESTAVGVANPTGDPGGPAPGSGAPGGEWTESPLGPPAATDPYAAGINEPGTFHPNAKGYERMARTLQDALS